MLRGYGRSLTRFQVWNNREDKNKEFDKGCQSIKYLMETYTVGDEEGLKKIKEKFEAFTEKYGEYIDILKQKYIN